MKYSSNEDYSKKIELFKKKGNNTKCFECNQKGTTYVCIPFGTFVCSECSGALSSLNYKVKGLGVASFNKNEYEFIIKNGNDRAKLKWLANFNPNKDKYPDSKNYDSLRKFIINKYQFKKYCKQDDDNDSFNDKNNNNSYTNSNKNNFKKNVESKNNIINQNQNNNFNNIMEKIII